MTIALVLAILVLATVLLITERIRADLVAVLILAALMLLRVLDPQQALSGFSNPATVTVACMFVISAGLQASGVVQFLGDRLLQHGPSSRTGLLLVTALALVPVSAFINNTAAVAVFLPIVLRACHGNGISPSYLAMPLSFFAMLGGACTIIGTSTNLIVNSIAEREGHGFSMFEFAPVGIILLLGGTLYLLTLGSRLIPERIHAGNLTEEFHLNRYLSEIEVLEGSPLVGQTIVEARLGERYDMEVLGRVRDNLLRAAARNDRLRAGDVLLVKVPAAALVRLSESVDLAVHARRTPQDADLHSGENALVEAVILPNSDLAGRSLKAVDFRNRFGATTLAIRRHGEDIREKIGKVILRVGDELLILAPRQHLERLRRQRNFVILEELEVPVIHRTKAVIATLIVVAFVALATLGWYSIATAAIAGAVAMVLSGCVPVRRVYESVDWSVIFLLAGLIPLGIALETSGAAQWASDWLLLVAGDWSPTALLGVFCLGAALLTGVMSNNATAALLAPLALTFAHALGVSPRPFLVGVALAASAAFYTPIGYQTNLLVYGPGGYRFSDFVRVGGPLTLIFWALSVLLIPHFFPF